MNDHFLETSKELVKQLFPILESIIEYASNFNDRTIYKGAKMLLGFAKELSNYNSLVEGGDLEDVDFMEEFLSRFDVMNRQNEKQKKLSLTWTVEGKTCPITSEQFLMKKCHRSWRLLPTILIDNAIKYAPTETSININLHATEHRKTIEISNWGPLVYEDELITIFTLNENYRGKNAKRSGIVGQGLGLKLASLIIRSHNWRDASISAICDSKNGFEIKGIPYSWFTVSFSIKNEIEPCENIIPLMSKKKEEIDAFLNHEFIRINPFLSKISVEILEDSFGNKGEYKPFLQDLRYKTYGLYITIMEHLYRCECL